VIGIQNWQTLYSDRADGNLRSIQSGNTADIQGSTGNFGRIQWRNTVGIQSRQTAWIQNPRGDLSGI
jgi:hypothetical protein